MEQKHMFTNKMIADLLIPVVLEQLLNSIMGTADTMMVSNVGSAAISAVSLVDSINVLVIQAFSALAAGGAIVCAQYIGQKNVKRANESARQVLFIITAISVVISLICLVFQKPMLRLIFGSVEAEVMRASEIYFFYTALSFPFIAAYDSAASIFRAQAMTSILENLNGIAAIGVGVGLMTIVGQCIGAGRKDEAVYYIKKLCMIAEVILIISCLSVFVLTKPITILGGMEKESADMCIHMTMWITIVKPLVWIMAFIPGYGMRAAGDVKFSMLTSCTTMWLCRFCLSVFMIRIVGVGAMGVWIGMFSDWTLRGIIFSWRFHSRKWLKHQVI